MLKTITLFSVFTLFFISCSGKKDIASHGVNKKNLTKKKIGVKDSDEDARKLYVESRINSIIEDYLGVSISSIARSEIKQTPTGYQWKFINVRSGGSYAASSDLNFGSVKINKVKKSKSL